MRTLWQIPYSPWSTKTRWALNHHGLDYRTRDYRIALDELPLRVRLRRAGGSVSVPVLFDGDQAIEGSGAIALHAEAHGEGEPLFFDEAACRRWNALADEACEIGRTRGIRKMLRDESAQRESLHGVVPSSLRGRFRPLARGVMRHLIRKYPAADEPRLEQILVELERGLDGERHLVGGRLSFADLAMASAVDFVVPLPLRGRGPAIEACWGSDELAARFPDVVAWRDELVGTLRPASRLHGD